MLKYNNTHLFTGYLKQLLSSFKLPTYKIYSLKNKQAYNENKNEVEKDIIPSTISRFVPYLRNEQLQTYTIETINKDEDIYAGKWTTVSDDSVYNINNFKSLAISSNIYDAHTHNYLGDFLRYQRDANNLDLMCLYNCFSDEMPQQLVYNTFNTHDKKYKIYMVPVKYLQEYTIAIDCSQRVEMFCGFYNKYFIMPDQNNSYYDILTSFMENTYKSYSGLRFNDPIIYDGLKSDEIWKILASVGDYEVDSTSSVFNFNNVEEDLKLFIKLPQSNTSSIVILEGNYLNWNDRQYKIDHTVWNEETHEWEQVHNWAQEANKFIVNFDNYNERLDNNTAVFKPITYLQLLQCNTGVNYPFADRLIEYLLGNTITNEEELEDNIKRIQKIIQYNIKDYTSTINSYYGLWDEYIRPVLYSYMQEYANNSAINHDLLGYVDKDVENLYKSGSTVTGRVLGTLKDIDLYPDIYLAAKAKEIKRGY